MLAMVLDAPGVRLEACGVCLTDRTCGRCPCCRAGRENLCDRLRSRKSGGAGSPAPRC